MVSRLKWPVVFSLNLFFGLAVLSAPAEPEVRFPREKITLVQTLKGKTHRKNLTVEVARTPEQHERGLMFREKLGADDGMLFIFMTEQPLAFWMKNTRVNLDIGYFNGARELIDIQQMAATSVIQTEFPSYPSKRPARYALEMPQGWFKKNGFREGTVLQMKPAK